MRALAVDLGGSHASCALVSGRTIVAHKSISFTENESLLAVLPRIALTLRELVDDANLTFRDFEGIALGFCGLVDTKNHRVLSTNGRYKDAHEIDLRAWSRELFGLELYIENDARLALLGERHAGAGSGADDLVMMTLGTGVGGAAMIEGLLLRGKHFQAGCLGGHSPINVNGRRCSCGNIGCVEAHASTAALPEICAEWPGVAESRVAGLLGTRFGFREVVELKKDGDRVAREIFDSCVKAWAAGAIALIHAYDPEHVIIGGGVMDGAADEIVPFIQNHIDRHAWTPWGKVSVHAAQLGNRAALLGAIPLIQGARQ